IVKKANISKGSLFNYFHSKKDLYVYLVKYSAGVINELFGRFNLSETDLFKRIETIGLQKLQIQKELPQIFDFLASSIQEEATEVRDVVKQEIDPIYEQGTEMLYENIDYSKFRNDVDIEKAIEILNWTMYGFGEKTLKQINTFEIGIA